jgi:hypothetical protein
MGEAGLFPGCVFALVRYAPRPMTDSEEKRLTDYAACAG